MERNPQPRIDVSCNLAELSIENDKALLDLHKDMTSLMGLRHSLFNLESSQIKDLVTDSLYADPSYNDTFILNDMGLRGGGVKEFHNEAETYAYDESDSAYTATIKRLYRFYIMQAAQKHGFITPSPEEASNPIDRELGIKDSTLESIPEKVDIIVAGAAGRANVIRIRDTYRNIESGAVSVNKIILTGCDRPVGDAERQRVEFAGFRAGGTEFESLILAAADVMGAEFEGATEEYDVDYGSNLKATSLSGGVVINGRSIPVIAVSAPFDPERQVGGRAASRANTEETFRAASPLLEVDAVLVESHDTWVPYQKLVAQQVFSVNDGKRVYATGPFNQDRVFINQCGGVDIKGAEAVVDEMAKVYGMYTKTRIMIQNKLNEGL